MFNAFYNAALLNKKEFFALALLTAISGVRCLPNHYYYRTCVECLIVESAAHSSGRATKKSCSKLNFRCSHIKIDFASAKRFFLVVDMNVLKSFSCTKLTNPTHFSGEHCLNQ